MSESLRDQLAAALEQHTETQTEEIASQSSEVTEETGRTRDDQGRFKAKQEETENKEQSAAQVENQSENERKAIPRPSSWKKDYEQDWETLPDKIREYINEREGQYAKGVSTYKNQWDQAQPFYEAVQPFIPELQQYNINPAQWIQNLGNAHRTLVLGTPDQKLQMFAQLANQYGIPLEALTGQQANPQFSMLANELNQIKNQWTTFQQTQQQQEQAALNNEIQTFAANAPHFEALRETMAQLLQSGMAEDLQGAYDKAMRLHDDIWQQQQAEQAKAAELERQKALSAKKAKAVSPKSASPTGMQTSGTGKKSLRDQLAESVESVMSGHI